MWEENECCNKWASVFVIVSNYTLRNNSVKAEPVCGPCTLTRQRPQDIHAPYHGPREKKGKPDCVNNCGGSNSYVKLCLFVSNGAYQQLHKRRITLLDKGVLCSISFTCVFYWIKDIPVFNLLNCFFLVPNRVACVCMCVCVCDFFIQAVKLWCCEKNKCISC